MNIYLAGRISSVDWRHKIVRGLKEVLDELDPTKGWPVMEGSIYVMHSYAGPFFKKIDKSNPSATTSQVKVHRLCLEAVDKSDLVYAWITDMEAFATIYELGWAQAKGKYTVIAYPPGFDRSELWFTNTCSDEVIEATSPEEGLLAATMRMAKAGRISNPAAEIERVHRNLARLQDIGRKAT